MTTYLFPVLTGLLIALFYLGLPSFRAPLPARAANDRGARLFLLLLTLAYAALAFFRLGDARAPRTGLRFERDSVVLELAAPAEPTRLLLRSGLGQGSFVFELSSDGEHWQAAGSYDQGHAELLKWQELSLTPPSAPARWLRVSGRDGAELMELALYDASGAWLPFAAENPLTDEQGLVPDAPDFLNSSYFDEIYHARTALEHLRGERPYEISHPPLGKLILSLGILLCGMTPFGWRLMGTLAGVAMLPVLWAFARRLYGGRTVPACCAALLAFDFMHFTQTRIATIDSYAVLWILLMYFFLYGWLESGSKRDLALSGLFFGLGAATKWTCLYAGAGLGVLWALHWIGAFVKREAPSSVACVDSFPRRGKPGKEARLLPPGGEAPAQRVMRGVFPAFLKNVGFCLVFFVLVPAAIYLLSYLPYAAPAGLRPFSGAYLRLVWNNQRYMFRYHSDLVATHPYSSRWYQWLLDLRPILFYLKYFDDGTRVSFGSWLNPVLCWAGLLSLPLLGWAALFRRGRRAAFLLVGYLAQLLPWVFVDRLTFEYHYFACSVFLVLALGWVFAYLRESGGRWRVPVIGLTALAGLVFALFYPTLAGLPVPQDAPWYHWLPGWPF